MPIYRPSELAKLGIRAKKGLSQNFLIDQNILEKICKAADIQKGDQVVEIGPGPGAITEKLLEKGASVLVIEKDKVLAEKLQRLDNGALEIVCGDALKFPLEKLPAGCKIVANLPYNITTPIIERLLRLREKVQSLTVVVQKEVGKRMTAHHDTPEYGSLTLFLKAYSDLTYCFTVKPTSFSPAPSVHSCVVHLKLHPFLFPFSEEAFFKLTRTAFGQRRKMLRGSLKEIYDSVRVEEALLAISQKKTARPGELSLDAFAALFVELQKGI